MNKRTFLNYLEQADVGKEVIISKENYNNIYWSPVYVFCQNLERTKRFKGYKFSVQSGRNQYILTRIK